MSLRQCLLKKIGKRIFLILLISIVNCTPGRYPLSEDTEQLVYGTVFTKGDAVRIIVYPDSQSFLNGIYPIDSDGNIFLPIVGNYKIISVTPEKFEQYLSQTFTPYLRFPEVQVRPLIRVSLLGGFENPGLYFVEPQLSLWDIVHLTGGTIHEDGLRQLRWERDKRIISKNLIPQLQSGESINNIGFISGDQLWTPSIKSKDLWTLTVREFLLRDILPLATIFLSIYYVINRD